MNILRRIYIYLLILMFSLTLNAQQDSTHHAFENVDFTGYVKYLNSSTFQDLNAMSNDNLIHNRLNLKVYFNDKFTASAEVRNRVFWGNSVQSIPNYASLIDSQNSTIDLSSFLVKKPALLVLTEIDRLNVNYNTEKWQITAGRQRINWEKNLAWNPNDIFNTYNFFDFDYEEHPGTDALRIQYLTSGNSSIETAINYSDTWGENTCAIKYNFHKFNYDFQLLTGKYINDITIGLGWEGTIKNVGFKGELSYFTPQKNAENTNNTFIGSLSFDYYFKNGLSVNFASLYNSEGITDISAIDLTSFTTTKTTPKSLMPNRWSFFTQFSKSLTPAITTSLSSIYAYELEGLFMMPQFSYSISENWDFDTTAQIFYGKENDKLSNLANSIYLRFRYSF